MPIAEASLDAAALGRLQRRTVAVLAAGQVLVGVGFGATVSLGALLAAELSGSEALSGLATASVTLGAAVGAIPLARLAARRGRRFSLTLANLLALVGIALVITAAATRVFPLLLVGILLIGSGNAGTLQSRFAATDLAPPASRGRDLAMVVWSTTVGAVLGPLMLGVGENVGQALGMPHLTGSYLFSIVAQIAAFCLYLAALRPDPLLTAQRIAHGTAAGAAAAADDRPRTARYAMLAIAGSHTVMVSVMAMTPIHLSHMVHDPGAVTGLVGVTIALHVAGMYGLSPVMGIMADRWGSVRVVLVGQVLLAASLITAALGHAVPGAVMAALILLGLGWSASTVAGSALLTASSAVDLRTRRQGLSDTLMSLCGALGAVAAGGVLSLIGYGGLALVTLAVVVAVTALSPLGRDRVAR